MWLCAGVQADAEFSGAPMDGCLPGHGLAHGVGRWNLAIQLFELQGSLRFQIRPKLATAILDLASPFPLLSNMYASAPVLRAGAAMPGLSLPVHRLFALSLPGPPGGL